MNLLTKSRNKPTGRENKLMIIENRREIKINSEEENSQPKGNHNT